MPGPRPSVLSGRWYPGDPADLTAQIDLCLSAAEPGLRPPGRARIAVVPHAGLSYSGRTAGHLYGLLQWDRPPPRIFILAPNHRLPLARIALPGADSFLTPLGPVPVDTAAVARLSTHAPYEINERAHADEHAIEIQLPFVQRIWPASAGGDGPRIVPLLVPPLPASEAEAAAAILATEIQSEADQPALLLVSTDFTHYGEAFGYVPFRRDLPAALEELDAGAILRILAADPAGLRAYGTRTGISMCGLEACVLALACGIGTGHEAALLHYRRSADDDGDYSRSVSYASILLCDGPSPAPELPDARKDAHDR